MRLWVNLLLFRVLCEAIKVKWVKLVFVFIFLWNLNIIQHLNIICYYARYGDECFSLVKISAFEWTCFFGCVAFMWYTALHKRILIKCIILTLISLSQKKIFMEAKSSGGYQCLLSSVGNVVFWHETLYFLPFWVFIELFEQYCKSHSPQHTSMSFFAFCFC